MNKIVTFLLFISLILIIFIGMGYMDYISFEDCESFRTHIERDARMAGGLSMFGIMFFAVWLVFHKEKEGA